MLQKDCHQKVYFSADMIEVIELNWPRLTLTFSKHITECYENLKCPECGGNSELAGCCRAEMFDSTRFLRAIKLARALQIKHRLRKAMENNPSSSSKSMGTVMTSAATAAVFSNTQASVFFTQNDAEYFTVTQTHHNYHHHQNATDTVIGDKSQYVKLNSILDALEHTGYYGFVTFIACVQSASLFSFSTPGLPTQKLTQFNSANSNLQRTQSLSTQIYRNRYLKLFK